MSGRTQAPDWLSLQGHYAGSVSRFVAYAVDLAVSSAVFALALAAISFVAQILTGRSIPWSKDHIVVAVLLVLWQFLYFGYSWAANGKTIGMALLGLRVVRADGAIIDPWRGVVRALMFPLSFLLFGLGFLGILVQREHRALHDLIAGTAVVYSWDARAARLRFLVREAEAGTGGGRRSSRQRVTSPGGGDATVLCGRLGRVSAQPARGPARPSAVGDAQQRQSGNCWPRVE